MVFVFRLKCNIRNALHAYFQRSTLSKPVSPILMVQSYKIVGKHLLKAKNGLHLHSQAQMAELVDALDSKSGYRKVVQVRFLFWAQTRHFMSGFFITWIYGISKKTELVDPSSAIQQFFNPFTDLMFCLTLDGIGASLRQPTEVKLIQTHR